MVRIEKNGVITKVTRLGVTRFYTPSKTSVQVEGNIITISDGNFSTVVGFDDISDKHDKTSAVELVEYYIDNGFFNG
jgi:hypothetical protein